MKVVFPVYYGSRYQMTKVPQHVFLKGMQVYHAVHSDMQQAQEQQATEQREEEAALAAAMGRRAAAESVRLRNCAAEAQAMCPCPPMAALPRQVMA